MRFTTMAIHLFAISSGKEGGLTSNWKDKEHNELKTII
jgi:hypothetical protein